MAFGLTTAFGLNDFVECILVGQISLISLSGISGILSGCIDYNGLIGLIGLSLVSLIGLVGHIGFHFVSLIGLSNLSITSLIDIIGQTGLIGPSALSACQPYWLYRPCWSCQLWPQRVIWQRHYRQQPSIQN